MTYGSSVSYDGSNVTVVLSGGTTLGFVQTGYSMGVGTSRCRLGYIADRNGNKIMLAYYNLPSTTDQSVMEYDGIYDAQGACLWRIRPSTTSSYIPGLHLLSTVNFFDGRQVVYGYNSSNTHFCNTITYSGPGASFSSTWNASATGPVTISDALLPAENYGWQMNMDSTAYGRVRSMLRGDGATYAYARAVTSVSDTSTTLTWNQGVVQSLVRSSSQQLISNQHQKLNRTWESATTFSSTAAYALPSSYTEPSDTSEPTRTTSVVRDPATGLVTQRTYADGSSELFTYNGFNQPLTKATSTKAARQHARRGPTTRAATCSRTPRPWGARWRPRKAGLTPARPGRPAGS